MVLICLVITVPPLIRPCRIPPLCDRRNEADSAIFGGACHFSKRRWIWARHMTSSRQPKPSSIHVRRTWVQIKGLIFNKKKHHCERARRTISCNWDFADSRNFPQKKARNAPQAASQSVIVLFQPRLPVLPRTVENDVRIRTWASAPRSRGTLMSDDSYVSRHDFIVEACDVSTSSFRFACRSFKLSAWFTVVLKWDGSSGRVERSTARSDGWFDVPAVILPRIWILSGLFIRAGQIKKTLSFFFFFFFHRVMASAMFFLYI